MGDRIDPISRVSVKLSPRTVDRRHKGSNYPHTPPALISSRFTSRSCESWKWKKKLRSSILSQAAKKSANFVHEEPTTGRGRAATRRSRSRRRCHWRGRPTASGQESGRERGILETIEEVRERQGRGVRGYAEQHRAVGEGRRGMEEWSRLRLTGSR